MKHVTLLCLLITAVYIPLACLDYPHTPYSDGAEHGAVLRELIRDIKASGEPMLESFTGKSTRYVPSLLLMASVARLADMDTLNTLKLFSILFFVFFLTSIIFFTREYFQDPEQAFWSVACMLFLWGTGWTGANAYMFSALVYTAWYPSLNNLQRLQILRHFNATKLVLYFPTAGQHIRNQITSMGFPLILQNDEVYVFDIPTEDNDAAPADIRHN
jgi:hypothetical protein